MAKQYIMKGLDADLWHAVKVKAAEQGTTVKDVIVAFLTEWIKK